MARTDPALIADERTTLCEFLDYHRATLVWKISGISGAQLSARVVPSSGLTLAGILKHLAHVEDVWLQDRFLGRALPEPWASAPFDDDPDWDLSSAVYDTPEQLLALYADACERTRAAVAGAESLDALSVKIAAAEGTPFSLRWILVHLIEETARHNGHVDLLREAIDGLTGE
jgi:hypothetical protein